MQRRRGSPAPVLACVGVVVLVLTACAEVNPNRARTRAEGIAEGLLSESDSAIFLIEVGERGLCSGVLITPHLLLTAAHCLSGQFVPAACEATPLEPALPVSEFRVTNWPDLQGSPPRNVFKNATSARVLFEGSDLCGNDLGLLELDEAVAGVVPLGLSAGPPQVGATFRMIGYGAGHSAGTGERVRRTSGELEVSCTSPESCAETPLELPLEGSVGAAGAPLVAPLHLSPGEWLGPTGACPGDSGGPALTPVNPQEEKVGDDTSRDSSGYWELVSGVLSRGTGDCALSIFSFPNRRELRAQVRRSAQRRGDTVPPWAEERTSLPDDLQLDSSGGGGAGGHAMNRAGAGGAPDEIAPDQVLDSVESSGCTCRAGARVPRPSSRSIWLFLTLVAATRLRRWRSSSC